MKFGHRFQAVIEATHPRVADQVRARPRRGGCSTPRVLTSRRGGGTPPPRLPPRRSRRPEAPPRTPHPLVSSSTPPPPHLKVPPLSSRADRPHVTLPPPPRRAPQFLCYKTLKKCLKSIPSPPPRPPGGGSDSTPSPPRAIRRASELSESQRHFVKTLNAELQKFNRFFMDAEEDLVMRESRVGDLYRAVVTEEGTRADGFTVDAHRRARKALADLHGELVLTEHWVSLNYTALAKILKKHDKISPELSIRSPFLVSVLTQPFYSTEVLSELIARTERRFRNLSGMLTPEEEKTERAPTKTLGRGENAETSGASGEGESASSNDSDDSDSAGEHEVPSTAVKRARAAISCWDGLKSEGAVLKPYGEAPRLGEGGGGKGGGEEATKRAKRG